MGKERRNTINTYTTGHRDGVYFDADSVDLTIPDSTDAYINGIPFHSDAGSNGSAGNVHRGTISDCNICATHRHEHSGSRYMRDVVQTEQRNLRPEHPDPG